MKNKKYIILLFFMWTVLGCAQDNQGTNRNYFKLCILNDKNEVLLVEYKGTWELIGGEYNSTITLGEYVDKLAMTSNVKVKDTRLRGLFSVYFNEMKKPYVYHYYSARYKSGKMKTPDDCSDAKWVDINEARNIIDYKDMLWMYETILQSENLWGGSYRITKDREKGTRSIETIVEYFKLN